MSLKIPAFDRINVLVAGDVILDRYWHGNTTRISPEAPVPIVHINDMNDKPGGAGNVALNLKSLGCEVSLASFIGDDAAGQTLENLLSSAHIRCFFQHVADFPTISKLRVLGRNQQLIRLDFEKSSELLKSHSLAEIISQQMRHTHALILSDYAKGSLHHIPEYIRIARAANVPTFVDPKSNDFAIYRGATIITPNLKEFEAVAGHCASQHELESKGHKLIQDYELSALLITQGENGMTLLQRGQPSLHLPTRAREVYDVTGAGDTVISVLAATYAAGESLANAAALANMAAGIVIRKLGADQVSIPELRRAVQRQQNSDSGVLSEEELKIAVADARAHQETIVMTNGCFDILHAGHVQYLEAAKKLGHRLIVAVNDDASVARLKGPSRPINPLNDRMAVLASLRAVDWVVAFSEDTPARLIELVAPQVLVKGGDYQVQQIAGADFVLSQGGAVEILDFKVGHSTTGTVEKIKQLSEIS